MYRTQENSTLNERLKVIPTARLFTKSSDSINRSKVVQAPKVRSGLTKSLSSSHYGTPDVAARSARGDDANRFMTRSISIASIFRVPHREREARRGGEETRGKCGQVESRDVRTRETRTCAKSGDNANTDEKSDSNAGRLTTIFNRIGSIRLRNRSINFESVSINISDKTNSKDDLDNRGDYNDEQNK